VLWCNVLQLPVGQTEIDVRVITRSFCILLKKSSDVFSVLPISHSDDEFQ